QGIRQLHEAGDALKISTETVSLTLDLRKQAFLRDSHRIPDSPHKFIFILSVLCLLSVYAGGCGARRPIADRRQPPPAQPSETPADTADSAKRSTDVPDSPAPPTSAVPTPKRKKPVPVPAPSGYTEEGNASWYGVPFH